MVCETAQADSIPPKPTVSACHRGNSLDGSVSSQASQERGAPHPRYKPLQQKVKLLSLSSLMGEVTEVLMNLLLFLNPRGAGCLSQTSNSTDLFWGLNKGVTLDIQWQSLEKSPAGLLWHFIWSFLIHWFLTIRDLQITWEFSSS